MSSSHSETDLLSLLSSPPRLPRILTVPFLPSDSDHDSPSPPSGRRIIVTNHLPITSLRLPSGDLSFSFDTHSLPFQFRSGLPSPSSIIHVGILRADIPVSEQDSVSVQLYQQFNCVPVFLPPHIHHNFYHKFCKRYLWPLLHYLLPLSNSHFDRRLWQSYLSANKIFADRITEIVSSEDDFVWAHDYHLLALPTFLRKRFPRIKLGFFFHSPFPSSEIFRALPVREEILRCLLNADLVGFHTFDYARHFLSCCKRILGLEYESKRGRIRLDYFGRIVTVKILHIGVDVGRLESAICLPETESKVRALKEGFKDRILLLGRDDMDVFKGISFKFLAMEKLLGQHCDLRGKAVLVQIANPARSEGEDVEEMKGEALSIAKRVNEKFGFEGYSPIVLIDGGSLETYEKIAYYAVADCCVVNPVRDGMNLVPYEYTICRPKKSVIVVSEFIGSSPSLSGAIRVNPWNVESMAEAMYSAVSMSEAEKKMRHEKHYKYVSSHDIAYWGRSLDQDLQKACEEHFMKRCWGIGFGLKFRVVALGPNFRKLSVEHIVSAYRRTNRRLILLDYDGTMMPTGSIVKSPSKEVVDVLNDLCCDEKNVVFLVSGRGRDSLSKWFDGCDKLGISAEHGYFTRWRRELKWESCELDCEFEWKSIVEPVMRVYTETTDGSYIEKKETAVVWHHQDADPDFGSCQAKELLDHLENVLANEPVVVKRGQHIVEVKPQGISKGIVAKNLISTMLNRGKPPDFILCIGDDRSDEDMFETIMDCSEQQPSLPAISEVFACTVGTKPSKAKYYLDDTVEVIKLLQGLTAPSSLPPKRSLLDHIPFKGSLTLDEL